MILAIVLDVSDVHEQLEGFNFFNTARAGY